MDTRHKIEKRITDSSKHLEVHFDGEVPSRSIKAGTYTGFGSSNRGIEINWPALGSVSIEEAENFAAALQTAIAEAKKL